MGKKRQRKGKPYQSGNGSSGTFRKGARWPVVLLGILVAGVGAYAYQNSGSQSAQVASVRRWVPGGERRRTLSPALFGGAVARAYRVAREIPEVLDKLFCYCYCIQGHGHKSNLSCFADRHAAG